MFQKVNITSLTYSFFVVFLFYATFEGVVRYFLLSNGLSYFVYLLKGIMLLALLAMFTLSIKNKTILTLFFLLVFSINGILVNGLSPVLIGLFILVPLIFFYSYPVKPLIDKMPKTMLLFLIVCILTGLIYDFYFDLPWVGFESQVNGVDVKGGKLWWTDGKERLAGFGRSSIETASLLSFFCIIFVLKNKNKFYSGLVIVLSVYGVHMTTTKGAMIALMLTLIYYFIPLRLSVLRTLYMIFILLLGNMVLLLSIFDVDVTVLAKSFHSLWERVIFMWPETIAKLKENGNIFGLGIGGVGVASSIAGDEWGAVDNFWLYVAATFGLVAWGGLLLISLLISSSIISFRYSPLYMFFLSYGITNNMIESIIGQVILALFLFEITQFKKHERSFRSKFF